MNRGIVRIAVTFVLLGLIAWAVDLNLALDGIADIDPTVGALVIVLMLIQNDLATTRWRHIAEALDWAPPHHRLLKFHYMGLFAQIFLPASIGGAAVRTWMIHREGIGLPVSISGVILDRLFAFSGLLILTAAVLPYLSLAVFSDSMAHSIQLYATILAGAAIAMWIALPRWPISTLLDFLERSFLGSAAVFLRDAAARILRPAFLARTMSITLASQTITMLAVYILAQGSGANINLIDCIFLIPPVMLLASLPISIAGWGVREGAMIVAFGAIGVSSEAALILSIQFGLLGTAASLLGAFCWFHAIDDSLRRELRQFRRS